MKSRAKFGVFTSLYFMASITCVSLSSQALGESPSEAALKWNAVPNAVGYVIEIARDSSFKAPIVKQNTVKPEFLWTNPEEGSYFYHVAAIAPGGKISVFSAPSRLMVSLPPPETIVPVANAVLVAKGPTTDVTFKWSASAARSRENQFRLEVAMSDKFAPILLSKTLAGMEATLKIASAGKYYWRVLAGKPGLTKDVRTSATAVFTLEGKEIKEGANATMAPLSVKTKATVTGSAKSVALEWQSLSSVESQRLVVTKQLEHFRLIVYSEVIPKEANTASIPLPAGSYFWRVEGRPTGGELVTSPETLITVGAEDP